VNGKRSKLSIRKTLINRCSQTGSAKGHSEESKKINQYIVIIQNKIYKIHQNFVENDTSYPAEKIRNYYLGKNEANKILLEIFKEHNK